MLQSGGIADKFIRVLLSPDGSRVYSNIEGITFWLDTSNDSIHFSPLTASNSGGVPDLAISGDGTTVDIDGFFTDPLLNPETVPVYVDWETWFPTATTGQKLNQDGSIMFQPLTDGLDLIARNTGRLVYRVQVPLITATVYDSLVVSGQNSVAAITAAGVSFVDLSTLPIPSGDSQPFIAATGPAAFIVPGQSGNLPARYIPSDDSLYLHARPRLKHNFGPKQSNVPRW